MSLPSIIAIDGPVASGKSAVGQRLAARLGYLFFDTGVMYRAVTYLALRQFGAVADAEEVTALARRAHIDVQPGRPDSGYAPSVWVDGEDITRLMRSPEVEANVSPVAVIPEVRQVLTEQMRRVGLRGQVVMVGRDVGTVILPEADLKIFLTASVEARARRRYHEISALGRSDARSYEDILANLRERDRIDASRATAPLRPAGDAVRIDTTDLELDAVVAEIERLAAARRRD